MFPGPVLFRSPDLLADRRSNRASLGLRGAPWARFMVSVSVSPFISKS